MDPRRPESTRHPGGEFSAPQRVREGEDPGPLPQPFGGLLPLSCRRGPTALRATRRESNHHPAHVTPNLDPDLLREFDQPIGIGKVIAVDTKLALNIDALARTVLTELADR